MLPPEAVFREPVEPGVPGLDVCVGGHPVSFELAVDASILGVECVLVGLPLGIGEGWQALHKRPDFVPAGALVRHLESSFVGEDDSCGRGG